MPPPDLFASIPAGVWRRQWVSFLKHYGHGNHAVLNYLSRYVFRTAISNARILAVDQTDVTFRYKHRTADTWRIMRLGGVEFLRRFNSSRSTTANTRATRMTTWKARVALAAAAFGRHFLPSGLRRVCRSRFNEAGGAWRMRFVRRWKQMWN